MRQQPGLRPGPRWGSLEQGKERGMDGGGEVDADAYLE